LTQRPCLTIDREDGAVFASHGDQPLHSHRNRAISTVIRICCQGRTVTARDQFRNGGAGEGDGAAASVATATATKSQRI
jgi:hypothetical protein